MLGPKNLLHATECVWYADAPIGHEQQTYRKIHYLRYVIQILLVILISRAVKTGKPFTGEPQTLEVLRFFPKILQTPIVYPETAVVQKFADSPLSYRQALPITRV